MGTYQRYYGRPPERRLPWYLVAAIATATVTFICVLATALAPTPARAGPPPPLSETAFTVPTVVCDTKDQAVSIATAAHDSTEAMLAKHLELKATKACVNSPIPYLVVNEREDFGMGHAAECELTQADAMVHRNKAAKELPATVTVLDGAKATAFIDTTNALQSAQVRQAFLTARATAT